MRLKNISLIIKLKSNTKLYMCLKKISSSFYVFEVTTKSRLVHQTLKSPH